VILLWIALGGALGSVSRFASVRAVQLMVGDASPWGTTFVNIVGSFAMGFLVVFLARKFEGNDGLRFFLTTGFLGGFTTFSAFSQDVVNLMQRGDSSTAIVYVGVSVIVSIAACFAGMGLAQSYG
jgi:fluoride exporter